MNNDPQKWESQTWSIPHGTLLLQRRGKEWYLTDFTGQVRIEMTDLMGTMLANFCSQIHEEEDWIYRHSLQFRWLQFWYKRRKKNEL